MEFTTNQPPIVVIRKKKANHGHHGGAWKVAYADFVTAMMALFIVLWLMASNEEVKKAVGGYFQDPTGRGKLQGSTQAGQSDALMLTQDNMDQLKDMIEQAMKEIPELKELEKNVQITVTSEGLRIELLEEERGLWFQSGSSLMSPRGKGMVHMLGERLKTLPNKLVLEGHTDAKPYPADTGYTNWELSADRANTARRILLESGVQASQVIQIRGFADQNLRNQKDPLDPANRRVSMIVQYRTAQGKAVAASKEGAKGGHAVAKPEGGSQAVRH